MPENKTRLPEILNRFESQILTEWIEDQLAGTTRQKLLAKDEELRQQCKEFLSLVAQAVQKSPDVTAAEWASVREFLANLSKKRGVQGFTMSETAGFIFSLKKSVFNRLRVEIKAADALAAEMWTATELLDDLGLHTAEAHLKTREEMIARQQQDMLELSTPVVKLWDGIVALPLIGTLDSARTQVVMESLLQKIVDTGSSVAIIDITGVPTVDTLVAQHLIKTVTAARLMGAECIISGIRPQIAQTIVHLGVALGNVTTKASLADAFLIALQKLGVAMGHMNRPSGHQTQEL